MNLITVKEMLDYIANIHADGIVLTPSGIGAARIILEKREGWTEAHKAMLARINKGEVKLPIKLNRLVSRTRLGLAIDLAMDLTRKNRKAERRNIRRNAARKAREMAAA